MGDKWIEVSLSEIAERIGDGLHGTPKYSEQGKYHFINGNNLEDGVITIKESTKKVGFEQYKKHKKELNENAILVSINGTIGNVALYNDEEIILGKSACYINLKDNIHREFVAYVLTSFQFQEYIQRCATGSTIKNVSLKMMREFAFRIPEDEVVQIDAVATLKNIDLKIRLNRQTNQTLEQMAQALFKSWFVDFDPVFDNAFDAGLSVDDFPDELQHRAMLRQQHRSEAMQQGAEAMMPQTPQSTAVLQPQNQQTTQTESERIRGLFPSEFEQCDDPSVGINGWIPKDWIAKSVSEVINVNPRTSLPKNSIAKFADMKALPTIGYMVNQITKKEFSGGAKFKQHDILLARITPCLENGKTALVDFLNDEEVGFGSTEFIVLRQKNKLSYSFIACLARDENFRKHCIQNMVGSSGRQRVQNSCFDIYLLSVPSNEKIFEKFTDLTKPNFEKMTINNNEINYLSKIRDTLLPKLISGELQLSEVVQSIETK